MFQLTCHQREALDPKQLRVGIEMGQSAELNDVSSPISSRVPYSRGLGYCVSANQPIA